MEEKSQEGLQDKGPPQGTEIMVEGLNAPEQQATEKREELPENANDDSDLCVISKCDLKKNELETLKMEPEEKQEHLEANEMTVKKNQIQLEYNSQQSQKHQKNNKGETEFQSKGKDGSKENSDQYSVLEEIQQKQIYVQSNRGQITNILQIQSRQQIQEYKEQNTCNQKGKEQEKQQEKSSQKEQKQKQEKVKVKEQGNELEQEKEQERIKEVPFQNNKSFGQKIMEIFEQCSIKEEQFQEGINFIKNNQISQCLLLAKKKNRSKLKAKIEQIIQEHIGCIQNQSTIFTSKIIQILVKFQIDEEDHAELIEQIKSGKIQEVSQNVKKSKRNQFKQLLKQLVVKLGVKNKKKQQNPQHNKRSILVKYSGMIQPIPFKNGEQLFNLIRQHFGIGNFGENQFVIDGKITISNFNYFNTEETGRILEIIPNKKKYFTIRDQIHEIWLEKNTNGKKIKEKILQILQFNDSTLEEIDVTYQMEKQLLDDLKNLQQDEIRFGPLKQIIIELFIEINLFYQKNTKKYRLKSSDTIYKLKKLIEKDYIPIQAQSIFYDNSERILQSDNQKKLSEIVQMNKIWHIQLKDTHTVQFYGFHENRKQNYDLFSQFFIENEEETLGVIKNSNFHEKNLEGLFFEVFIKNLYSGIKKRFPIQNTIDKFKEITVSVKSENLWMPYEQDKSITMNQSFVAMYLLFNSDEKLRIALMKLIGSQLPLPIYFRNFSDILNVSNQFKKNQQLSWVLKEGITILSIGLHNLQKLQVEKGKSTLLNHLFYTNFPMDESKHQIVRKVPFVSVNIYQELFALNIIDVPSDCSKEIRQQLFQYSDIVIVHSWRSKQVTDKIKKSMEDKYHIKVVVIYRDVKILGQQSLKMLKEKNILKDQAIQIQNIKNYEKSKSSIDLLREQFNQFLKQIKGSLKQQNKIMLLSKNNTLAIMDKEIQYAFNQNNLLKFLDKKKIFDIEDLSELEKQQNTKENEKLVHSGLDPCLQRILQQLSEDHINIEISLDFFRQKLRQLQKQKTSRFMKIYKLKIILGNFQDKSPKQLNQKIKNIHQQLLQLPELYRKDQEIIGKSIEQIYKIFDGITSEFENKIRPKIFSTQLFWREVYCYLQLSNEVGNKQIYQKFLTTVINLKTRQIMNNQPFQIIDGDSLKMPKQIMYQVFKPITDKCLVVTILGPQSSGKSTLLNFLFGCDFATSQGRCTRGVYGTFFKVNSSNITNFDGIFVIDTEGLFAVTNDNDSKEQYRQDFDSKLVLFCLAISDVVIINVRGNLDLNTQKILRICYEKLEVLNKSEETKPQIIIVLNQNSTSKTEQSQNQFKKIRRTLNFKIAKSLSMAYIIKNYSKQNISIFSQNQVLTKKVPQAHFRKQTSDLLKEIVASMKHKKTAEKIVDKIDKFQSIWTTVLAFPNLSKMKTKQYSEFQTKIKSWKKLIEEQNSSKYKCIVDNVKNQIFNEKKAEVQLEKLNEEYLQKFKKQFECEKMDKQLVTLIQSEQKQIMHRNQNQIMKLKYNLTQQNLKKQLNREKFEGDFILREVQNEIIRNQNLGLKQYTDNHKEQLFNQCFNKGLQKIKKSIRLSEKYRSEYERVREQYQLLIRTNKSSMQAFGLLKGKLLISQQLLVKSTLSTIQQNLKKKYLNPNKPQQFFMYIDKPHTNILKGGNIDAKLKYFNIRQYYQKKQKYLQYYISRNQFSESFRMDVFLNQFEKKVDQFKSELGEKEYLKEVFEQLNKYLQIIEIRVKSLQNFINVYRSHSKGMLTKFKQYFIPNQQIKLQIQYIKKKKQLNEQQYQRLGWKIKNQDNPLIFIKNFENIYIRSSSRYYYSNSSNYESRVSFKLQLQGRLSQTIEQSIQWKTIKEDWNSRMNNKSSENQVKNRRILMEKTNDEAIRFQLNQDLKLMNLQINKNFSMSELIRQRLKEEKGEKGNSRFQNKFFTVLFQNIGLLRSDTQIFHLRDFEEFRKKWGQLKYFNGRRLKQSIRVKQTKIFSHQQLLIGKVCEEYLAPTNQQFQKYNDGDSLLLKNKFKNQNFKTFIFLQLLKNSAINLFSNQLFTITKNAHKKWGRIQSKTINEIYKNTNEEITKFNDDLNQISYQMTPKMMGKVHEMTIYLIWKYQIDTITKKQNEIYYKKIQSREEELNKFLMRTSNNINQKIQQQVQTFQQKILEYFEEQVQDIKDDLFEEQKNSFIYTYDRKQIQNQIDLSIFQRDTDPEIILQYLEKPIDIISNKYNEKYEEALNNIKRNFFQTNQAKELLKDLNESMQQFKNNLQNVDKIAEENGAARDLFEMTGGQANQADYDEEAKKLMFSYFIDILLHEDPSRQRQCFDLILRPKNQLAMLRSFKNQFTVNLFSKIKYDILKITNLPKFLAKFTSEESLANFEKKLNSIYQFQQFQQKSFINEIRVVICSQKCPCCGRICGIQKTHTFHKCLYGHQMRALAGNYIMKGDGKKQAYVVRCDQLQETDIMEYNGNKYTWTQFKDYWANKPVGGWHYDDTVKKLDPEDKRRFQNAWLKAGSIYCHKKGLQFVHYNDSTRQKQQMVQNAHFIFALDESGSMQGSSWSLLMKALGQTIQKIRAYSQKGGNAFITIINFNNDYRVIYERMKPQQISLTNINNNGGGTTFGPVFKKASEIAQKTIHKESIIFVFMTDGGAQYPNEGISVFKSISQQNPKKFIYSGIQLGCESQNMKNISYALGGKNIRANNLQELLQAYESAIEIIAFKEDQSFGIMPQN